MSDKEHNILFSKLPAKPEMEQEIINAIDSGDLLIFVGAGISKLIGYPLWMELGKKLADHSPRDVISLSQKSVLFSSGFTPMQIVTILSRRLDKKEKGLGLKKVVEELSIEVTEKEDVALKIAGYLAAYNATIITTNADKSLEKTPLDGWQVFNSFEEFPMDYKGLPLIHLHGSIEKPSEMVFTSEKYAEKYDVESAFGKKLWDFLRMKQWTILFVGYGVSEFELLRYFINFKNDSTRRMFMLSGYLEKDSIKYEFDSEYFKSLGIYLLPYSREENDYMSLLNVLEKWDKTVKTKTYAGSTRAEEIVESITSLPPTKESAEIIIKKVNKHG